jgi:hypothetical protein
LVVRDFGSGSSGSYVGSEMRGGGIGPIGKEQGMEIDAGSMDDRRRSSGGVPVGHICQFRPPRPNCGMRSIG